MAEKSSSRPARVDFPVKQGDTFRRVFTFQTKDESPQPIDLTGATFKLIIEGEDDITLGNGLSVIGEDNNQVLLEVDITWAGKKKYELERVMNGITWTPFEGIIDSSVELPEA